MSFQIVPLTCDPNQTFNCTLTIDGKNRNLKFKVSYNAQAEYWVMTVMDGKTGDIILDSIPLITGEYPAANLLEQYGYLGIGSATIVKLNNLDIDYPDDTTLGTDFVLGWGDTIR